MEKSISGMMIYYYFVCNRKLWYFSNEIRMEQENENVLIGKIVENSFTRKMKHINIDNVINIDYISEKHILHEVKKSRSIEEAGIWQIKYYIYYLRQKGVLGISGQIDYPLLHKKIEVELSDKDIQELEKFLIEIQYIICLFLPPTMEEKSICKKCAYRDLCFI